MFSSGLSLLSQTAKLEDQPFPHLLAEKALSQDRYDRLADSFPPLELLAKGRRDYGSNQVIRLAARNVLANPAIAPEWRDFFAFHTSADFWRDFVTIFGDAVRRTYPELENRIGKPLEEWKIGVRGMDREADAMLDCLFVVNTPVTVPSSVKPPHVDRSDKLFTGLFYCRHPQDNSPGGDLDLYRLNGCPTFDKHQVPVSQVTKARTVPYSANTFLGFVSGLDSVHGVSPRPVTPHVRRYIDLVCELPFKLMDLPQMGTIRRTIHRAFYRQKSSAYNPEE